jgi:hypothetical protein
MQYSVEHFDLLDVNNKVFETQENEICILGTKIDKEVYFKHLQVQNIEISFQAHHGFRNAYLAF